MMPGLASVQPPQPTQQPPDPRETMVARQDPAMTEQDPAMEQSPMMARYAGDDDMGDDADASAEAAMGLISNPSVGPALQVLQQAAQQFPTKGQSAFRNPQTLEALSLALKPIIGQSIGSPLGEGEVVGDVSIADLIPTDHDTMLVKLLVQPTDESGQPTRDPYEAMLTDGRVPESKGGKPRELTKPEVQQALQSLAKVYQIQQQFPDDISRISQGVQGRPPPEHQDLVNLLN